MWTMFCKSHSLMRLPQWLIYTVISKWARHRYKQNCMQYSRSFPQAEGFHFQISALDRSKWTDAPVLYMLLQSCILQRPCAHNLYSDPWENLCYYYYKWRLKLLKKKKSFKYSDILSLHFVSVSQQASDKNKIQFGLWIWYGKKRLKEGGGG